MYHSDDLIRNEIEDLSSSRWERFVYFSESLESEGGLSGSLQNHDRPLTPSETSPQSEILPLSSRRMGDRICIVELECGDTNQRLIAMGLIPGAVLEIVSTTATGSVIVALQDQRLGLGAEMAQRIQVADIAQPSRANAADSTRPSSRITTMQTSLSQSIQTSPSQSPVKLRDVAIGTTLKIVGYEPVARDYKRKLLAMGLTPGTEFKLTRHAPLGDPTEIEIRGFHLSLRKNEADALVVEPI